MPFAFMRVAILIIAAMANTVLAAPSEDDARRAIQERIEHMMFVQDLTIDGVPLLAGDLLAQVYADRDYRPAWSRPDALDQLSGLVALAVGDGLPAADYPLEQLIQIDGRLRQPDTTAADVASFDLLASELLARVAFHLRFGKVDPKDHDPAWNFDRDLRPAVDPDDTLDRLSTAPDVAAAVDEMFPHGYLYQRARQTLAEYRAIQRAGGWPLVSEGPVLKKGDRGPRVAELRFRLLASGRLLDDVPDDPQLFDAPLEQAAASFQRHHGLEPDGVVGNQTVAAMNVGVQQRIDQLRLTLERARWVMNELDQRFVVVNIAGFYAGVVENREFIWFTPVQVGTPYRKTPVFRGEMEYVVFNPTWVVPPTILRKDILPKLATDPGYLAEKNMRVLDQSWTPVDASTVDWGTMSARNFPYILEQQPGPSNALGRVKFIFPNPHFVFLHDTPSQSLFDRASRSFSSGCIRVKEPLELARLVLDDSAWSFEQIETTVEAKATKTVHLARPLPVYLLYWTADFHPETGAVYFHPDVYSRDATLLNALDGEVSLSFSE